MVPVTGRANVRNQCPPVAKLIYSRYSPMAAKSAGTKITGLGLLNHRGSTARIYSSNTPPEANPDHTMVPFSDQSHRMQITMGSTASMVRMNSAPERFTSSGWADGSGGKGGSPCCRGRSGWNTRVPHRGHTVSLSDSSTPQWIQYMDNAPFPYPRPRWLLSTFTGRPSRCRTR